MLLAKVVSDLRSEISCNLFLKVIWLFLDHIEMWEEYFLEVVKIQLRVLSIEQVLVSKEKFKLLNRERLLFLDKDASKESIFSNVTKT